PRWPRGCGTARFPMSVLRNACILHVMSVGLFACPRRGLRRVAGPGLMTLLAATSSCGDDVAYMPDSGQPKSDATIDQSTKDAAVEAEAPAPMCLASSGADAFFTINDTSKCVIGAYQIDTFAIAFDVYTWGRHGGPVIFSAPDIKRFTVPSAATG